MATLEKIRKRSVLLFTIIIVALLAFILGDFINSSSSFFGPGDTVASANGVKVDFQSYQNRVAQASENLKNNPQQQDIDNDVISQQVINQMLVERLLQKEYERLGINVTDDQLSNLFFSPEYSQGAFMSLLQQFGQQGAQALVQMGITDIRSYADAMNNPGKYQLQPADAQTLKQVWRSMEEQLDQTFCQQAYLSLVSGLFTASEVDAKAMYADRNTTNDFTYARKDLSSVPDKDIKLTDADYQAYYDAHKGAYRLQEEVRQVSYIIVPIVPSDDDYRKAQSDAEAVYTALANSEGTEVLRDYPAFVSNSGKFTRASMSGDNVLRTLLTDSVPLAVGQVRRLSAPMGTYNIAKITGESTGIDLVKFSMISLPLEADSLLAGLTVENFDSIAPTINGQAGINISLVNAPSQLTEKMKSALASQPVGQIFSVNDTVSVPAEDGTSTDRVLKSTFLINEREAPTNVYDITYVTYTVDPSKATVTDLNTKFHAFVGNNASAEAFAANAEKSGYTVQNALVSRSTPSVGNARSSRGMVKWAMENKKGKVSPVFNQSADDYLIAVAVDDVYDGEYLPVTAKYVRDEIEPLVLADKKAQKLIEQFAGKASDVNGYAKLFGGAAAQTKSVFGEPMVSGIGFNEYNVQGAAAGAQKGKLVGPFKGNNAIYVINVTNTTSDGRPYDFKEYGANFSRSITGQLINNPLMLLVGDGEVSNNILTFTSSEVN